MELADRYAITAILSRDLYGVKYYPNNPHITTPVGPKKRTSRNRTRERKTLEDLVMGNVTSADYRMGFDDGVGNIVYVIERIIRYDPDQGFLVHWKNCPKSQRSYVSLEGIPESCNGLVESAVRRYEKRRRKSSDPLSEGRSH